jgi:hypothetical protein
MAASHAPGTLELLRWVESGPRSYAETIEAWSSWCPRHSVWEDAVLAGLVRVVRRDVVLTPLGRAALQAPSENGRLTAAA